MVPVVAIAVFYFGLGLPEINHRTAREAVGSLTFCSGEMESSSYPCASHCLPVVAFAKF